MATPKQTDPQFKLRMTVEIKEAIEKAALENNRSMNAEILARLEQTIKPQTEALPPITAEIFDQLFSRLDQIDQKVTASKNQLGLFENTKDSQD